MNQHKSYFNYSKLRGRIREIYGSEREFAQQIGIANVALSAKLNGKTRFSQDDIRKFAKMLHIIGDDIGVYFFTEKV